MKTFWTNATETYTHENPYHHFLIFSAPVSILDWQNFCISYSVGKRRLKLMHNGVLELNFTRSQELKVLDDYIPLSWFTSSNLFVSDRHSSTETFHSSFTNFNVWDLELSDDQMRNFTQCSVKMEGNLIPWNIDTWNLDLRYHNTKSIEQVSLCKQKVKIFNEILKLLTN